MASGFHELSTSALRCIAEALRTGRLRPPVTPHSLARLGLRDVPPKVAVELQALFEAGADPAGLAWGVEQLVGERAAQRAPDLVWTGPEMNGSASRDTGVVVRELFAGAKRSVLVATYAVYQGAEVFGELAERMTAIPELSVRVFLNIPRPQGTPPHVAESQLVRRFMEEFVDKDWPSGARLPEIFYDPRALSAQPGPKACLHAKCIVVDGERTFVTSANFTEAAQERNIEAGVLVHDPAFARALIDQFESLVTAGLLRRAPGLSR